MKKYRIIALILVCVLIFTGCSLVSPNEEKIANQVVATVNGVEIYKYEVDEMVDMYAMQYGIDVESEDEVMVQALSELKKGSLDSLITNQLLLQKGPDLGFELTEETLKSNQEQTDSIFDSRKDEIRALIEEEAKIDNTIDVEAEFEKRFAEFMEDTGSTPESYMEFLNEMSIVSQVQAYMYSQADLTDQDLQVWYDKTLEVQIDEMQNSPQAFEAYVHQRNIYTYIPEDTVAVKQVLLKFKDEELIAEATTLYGEDKIDEMMTLLQPEIDALMPTALDVKQRLEDGENLDDLIEELGEDEGMTTDPTNVYGYLVGESTERYLSEFSEAALALMNVGDISEPVVTYYGLHILQSIKLYEAGPVPFEDKMEEIRNALLPEKEQTAFAELEARWREEADIIYYIDRLG